MSEEEDGITPTTPVGGYAPEPSEISRDRDAEGAIAPRDGKKRNKRRRKRPKRPADKEKSPEGSKEGHSIDIRASGFQIEMPVRTDLEDCSALTCLIRFRTLQGAHEHGTAIAYPWLRCRDTAALRQRQAELESERSREGRKFKTNREARSGK